MTISEACRVFAEMLAHLAQPVATIIAALIMARGAKDVAEKIIEAKGCGAIASAVPPSGTARSIP